MSVLTPMQSRSTVSVVIPLYNEVRTLPALIQRITTGVAREWVSEIVLVDDGSEDGSGALIESLKGQTAIPLRLIRHPRNRGKGAAVRTGMEAAGGDIVLIQDADLEYDPADYPALLAPFSSTEVQVVYGSRNLRANPRSNWRFYWGGRLLSVFTNLLYGSAITDEATGYKVMRRSLVGGLGLKQDGFEFCPELTAKLLRRGIKIHEVPISYLPRTRSEGKKIRMVDGWYAIWTLLRLRFSRDR